MDNRDKPEKRCIAVDFDATLSFYEHFEGPDVLGKPIPEMVKKVKAELAKGVPVVIFTARVNPSDANPDDCLSATKAYVAIAKWTEKVFGQMLGITHEKSRHFTEMWDDRGRQVLENTGAFITELMDAAK
jgi:hypothetical protein